jgi:hypothetical protein
MAHTPQRAQADPEMPASPKGSPSPAPHGEDQIEATDNRADDAGTTSGLSLAGAPTSSESTSRGGWRWCGSS